MNGVMRTAWQATLALALGLVLLYIFFAVVGTIDPFDVLPLTILVLVAAALFGWHTWRVRRQLESGHPDPELLKQRQQTRERRGF
ncbi:MAG: hypothetical protein ACR2NA_04495 [Solirubrobacterales bacterium]